MNFFQKTPRPMIENLDQKLLELLNMHPDLAGKKELHEAVIGETNKLSHEQKEKLYYGLIVGQIEKKVKPMTDKLKKIGQRIEKIKEIEQNIRQKRDLDSMENQINNL